MRQNTGMSCSRGSDPHSTALRWYSWWDAPPSWGYPSSEMSLHYLDVIMNETHDLHFQYNQTYSAFLKTYWIIFCIFVWYRCHLLTSSERSLWISCELLRHLLLDVMTLVQQWDSHLSPCTWPVELVIMLCGHQSEENSEAFWNEMQQELEPVSPSG